MRIQINRLFLISLASVVIINSISFNHFVLSQSGGECDSEWQRGQCLYDANGKYYYDVNNCSERPGSSGRPGISQCQDIEHEIQVEEEEEHAP